MTEFFKLVRKESTNLNNTIHFIIPIYLYHIELLPVDTISQLVSNENNYISGFLIFIEHYKKLTIKKIQTYKNFVQKCLNGKYFIRFGKGDPSKIF